MSDGGLSSFQKRMRAIPKAAREAVQPVLLREAEKMAETMRALAPDDPATDAPDLKSSIAVTGPGQTTPPYSQPGGSAVVPENMAAITVGNEEVRYPHMVEYGTAPHAVDKGANNHTLLGKARKAMKLGTMHPGTPAQPFFWPAFRMHSKKSLAAIKRGIGKAIREAK